MKILPCLLLGILFFTGCSSAPKEDENAPQWFTLENITFDTEERKITGNSTEIYEGEMEVYLPDDIDASSLQEGQTVKVYGGPGMTMSLPPQLMHVSKIKIVSE